MELWEFPGGGIVALKEDAPEDQMKAMARVGHTYRDMDPMHVGGMCAEFMMSCGLTPTPDAADQLYRAFLPCLEIMCSRPWDPEGSTWRESGVLGILTDIRKKFSRLWERGWKHGRRHDDSALDLINYLGFYLRSDPNSGWGEWGDPSLTVER